MWTGNRRQRVSRLRPRRLHAEEQAQGGDGRQFHRHGFQVLRRVNARPRPALPAPVPASRCDAEGVTQPRLVGGFDVDFIGSSAAAPSSPMGRRSDVPGREANKPRGTNPSPRPVSSAGCDVVRALQFIGRHPKGGVLPFRRDVPPHLRAVLGQKVVTETLGTKHGGDAFRLGFAIVGKYQELFDEAEAMQRAVGEPVAAASSHRGRCRHSWSASAAGASEAARVRGGHRPGRHEALRLIGASVEGGPSRA